MKLKQKIGGAVLALAVVAGAIPGTMSSAAAWETGQLLDKGPRWPNKPLHFVELGLGIAAMVALIVVLSDGSNDRPTSP